jgi:hypothetical protein
MLYRRLKQQDHEFKACVGYIATSHSKQQAILDTWEAEIWEDCGLRPTQADSS